MWNSFRTDARSGITAGVITYPGGNGDRDPRLPVQAGRG